MSLTAQILQAYPFFFAPVTQSSVLRPFHPASSLPSLFHFNYCAFSTPSASSVAELARSRWSLVDSVTAQLHVASLLTLGVAREVTASAVALSVYMRWGAGGPATVGSNAIPRKTVGNLSGTECNRRACGAALGSPTLCLFTTRPLMCSARRGFLPAPLWQLQCCFCHRGCHCCCCCIVPCGGCDDRLLFHRGAACGSISEDPAT